MSLYQPNAWQHAVVTVDKYFYRYDYHDGKLSKYSMSYLVRKHEDVTCMIRVEKLYDITKLSGRIE